MSRRSVVRPYHQRFIVREERVSRPDGSPPLRQDEAEDLLRPLAQAGDTLHDYVVGTAAQLAEGAGDWIDVLEALDALTTAQRTIRGAHDHLINAMSDKRIRLGDPLGVASAVHGDEDEGDLR